MADLIGVRFWYTRGRIYNSAETDYRELPGTGLLFIMEYETGGLRRALHGCSQYGLQTDGRWIQSRESARCAPDVGIPLDALRVIDGEEIPNEEWEILVASVYAAQF